MNDIDNSLRVKHNSVCLYKGSHRNQNGTFTDIVQYLYAYIPDIGYVVEFQIGHQLAAYTFTIDSALRDGIDCGMFDMWKTGLYDMLKTRLLEKANGLKFSVCKYDIYDKTWSHFGSLNPPKELKDILDDITGGNDSITFEQARDNVRRRFSERLE